MVKVFLSAFLIASLGLVVVRSVGQADKGAQPASSKTGITLYVSPSGDDGNPGAKAEPIRTIEHAQELVRQLNQRMASDINVYLSRGVYRLRQPLRFDARDSGMNGHTIIYKALDAEWPVITGALQVTGWKQANRATNLWSAPVPAGLKNTRQLYVNGVRAQRARGRVPVSLEKTGTGYLASSPTMENWRNPNDIEFVYTGGNPLWSEGSYGLGPWTEPRCAVAKIEGTVITMADPCWDNSTKRVMLPNGRRTANLVGPASVGGQPAYVENAFELLGRPGDWYLDRHAGILYYIPRPGEDLTKADVEAPVLEKLIIGQGSKDAAVHDITFSHLQFSYATWLDPSTDEGFSEIQANVRITGKDGYRTQGLCQLVPDGGCPYGSWTKAPGNVSFVYDKDIRFVNDAFVHLGAAGLDLGNGSQSDLVEGSVFTDISGNGLELGDVDLALATGADVTSDNQILNNHLYETAAEYHGGVAIFVGYAARTTIKHQQIDHLPYTAVSCGWGGWPDKIEQAGQANFSQNNTFGHNLIFDHMLLLADGGGIYTQGLTGPSLSQGEKIYATVVRDQFGSGHGIYTDNGSANITIDHNVILNTNFDNWGSRHKDYYDGLAGTAFDPLDVESNYWQQGTADSTEMNVTIKGNHIISTLAEAPASITDRAGLEPKYRGILDLTFAAPSAPEPPSRVAAFAGADFAYVSWNPPILEGGSPVESYVVSSSAGDAVTISSAEFWSEGYAKIPRLSKETAYTFTVTARNAHGTSSPSLPSGPVTTTDKGIRTPSAPTRVEAFVAGRAASIHFGSPTDNGGSPIIAYTIRAHPGDHSLTLTGRSVVTLGGRHTLFGVLPGLQGGQQYTFDVAAVNAAGIGAATSATAWVP